MTNSTPTPPESTAELKIQVSPEYQQAIAALSEREGLSEEALAIRAIGLYAMAVDAEKGGYGLTFTRLPQSNDLTVRDIIRFSPDSESNPEYNKSRLIFPR